MLVDQRCRANCVQARQHHRHLTWHVLLGMSVIVGSGFHASGVNGQTRQTMEEQKPNAAAVSERRKASVRGFVEAIVNHNRVPKLNGESERPLFATGFDWSEHDRAWKAIQILIRHAQDAWPELVRHLDDDRYSTTIKTMSGSMRNWSVGDVCRIIVARNLSEAYYQNLRPESEIGYARMRTPAIARDKSKLKSWCEQRQKKKLHELQIEMCEWALTELKKPGEFPPVSPLRLRAWITAIEAEIESLRESETPVLFWGFGREEFTPYSAPRGASGTREEAGPFNG